MRSLRLRLILVLAAVVATAMGVVFLYVVPTLRDNLIAGRLKRLEQVSHAEQERDSTLGGEIAHLSRTGVLPLGTHKTVRRIGRLANARVAVFQRRGGAVLDTRVNGLAGVTRSDPIVLRAARTGFASGHRGGTLVVAFTVGDVGLVALSQQVSDVNQTADLVERRILIAAALALLVAMLVGWASAHAVTRRLSHLEQGARRIALGEFDRPIGDQSPDELGQLGRAFDLMQTRLDRADRVRKEFVANASHELRTPLFSLSGFMELLDDEDLDEETRAAFMQQMREQVHRLTKLATDLLDLSRLDADAVAVEHEPIDMASAARGLVREFRGLAVGYGSRISLVKPDASRTRSGMSCGCSRWAGRCSTTPSDTTRRAPTCASLSPPTTAACGWMWPTTGLPSTIRPPATCSSGSTAARPPARLAAALVWPSPASWPNGWTGGWSW